MYYASNCESWDCGVARRSEHIFGLFWSADRVGTLRNYGGNVWGELGGSIDREMWLELAKYA